MLLLGVLLVVLPVQEAAAQDTLTRPLSMGQAFRSHGAGNGALFYNPAAMSLIHTYSIETSYLNLGGTSMVNASVVDTKTSALGAGVAYNYLPRGDASDDQEVRVGVSTALLSQALTVGAMGRYAWLGEPDREGFSLDVGMVLTLGNIVGLGVVLHNLMPSEEISASRRYGFGASYTGMFTAAFDLVMDPAISGGDRFGYHGGLEFLLARLYPLRLGYEALPRMSAHYISMGVGALSPQAGIQLAFRQRLDDSDEQSFCISLNFYL